MPSFYSDMPRTNKEPRSRFYPTQGSNPTNQPPIPSAPTPPMTLSRPVPETLLPHTQIPTPPTPQENRKISPTPTLPERRIAPREHTAEMPYFQHRYPIMLQRLYDTAGAMLDTYSNHDFLYDAYPDYLSLRLMRDRLLRENQELTEEFLQAGCPIQWLEMLTDTIVSELLYRRRREKARTYLNPMGEASTTSVQSVARS